jgi:hypothetical protein
VANTPDFYGVPFINNTVRREWNTVILLSYHFLDILAFVVVAAAYLSWQETPVLPAEVRSTPFSVLEKRERMGLLVQVILAWFHSYPLPRWTPLLGQRRRCVEVLPRWVHSPGCRRHWPITGIKAYGKLARLTTSSLGAEVQWQRHLCSACWSSSFFARIH